MIVNRNLNSRQKLNASGIQNTDSDSVICKNPTSPGLNFHKFYSQHP